MPGILEYLNHALISAAVMAFAEDDGEYILDTDASDSQIAAVLSQVQDGKESVISYGSRTLNKAEKNYCITDKELLGIRHFVEFYRQYLLGRHFLVRSDHQALVWLFRLKEPKGRIARWIEILSEYDFSIEYRAGAKHSNADALSRCPNPWDCDCGDVDNLECLRCGPCMKCKKRSDDMELKMAKVSEAGSATKVSSVLDVRMAVTRSMDPDIVNPVQPDHESKEMSDGTEWVSAQDATAIRQKQQGDSEIKWILDALMTGSRPTHPEVVALSPVIRHYWSLWDSLQVVEGMLFKRFHKKDGAGSYLQFVVPKSQQPNILHQMHDAVLSGHLAEKENPPENHAAFFIGIAYARM